MSTPVAIDYVKPGTFDVIMKPVPRRGFMQLSPGQGASGYGSRISTDRMIRFHGEHTMYRVFCVCWSNTGTQYIVRHGKTLYFRTFDLE